MQLGQEKAINRVALSAYTIDGKHLLNSTDTLSVDQQAHTLTLFLTAFAFDYAADITFAYRMNQGEWITLDKGENIITFQHIPYGTSTIEAKAMDNYGQWSAPSVITTLVHPRPWYAYLWIPALIIAVLATAFIYRRYQKKQKAKYAERIRKYQSEKDDLQRKLEEAERKAKEIGYDNQEIEENYQKLSASDQEFIEKAKNFIVKNLSNVEYGVDALSADLCMSRMSLYRKIRNIIEKSPTDLIRDTRLEHAEMLLKTTSYSINEISDLCGFSYPSYFTKCFKEKYGKAPKEYR